MRWRWWPGSIWRLVQLFILDRGVMVTLEHRQCTSRSRSFPLGHGGQEHHSDSGVVTEIATSAVNCVWKRCYISIDLSGMQDRNETMVLQPLLINT